MGGKLKQLWLVRFVLLFPLMLAFVLIAIVLFVPAFAQTRSPEPPGIRIGGPIVTPVASYSERYKAAESVDEKLQIVAESQGLIP